MRLPSVTLLDPAVGSRNLGDRVISEAARREILRAAPAVWLEEFSSHQALGVRVASSIRRSDVALVGGSNLLDVTMGWTTTFNQWGVGIGSVALLRGAGVSLLGVGSTRYEVRRPSLAARTLLPRLLDGPQLHAVRDHPTKGFLDDLGVANVVVTGCPTMWDLTSSLLEQVPTVPGAAAVITVTDYRRSPEHDRQWLQMVWDRYERVYVWPQGQADAEYVVGLGFADFGLLAPSLADFDRCLRDREPAIDYVGTRIHAGIRAAQFGRRPVILTVDTRSRELSRSVGLPVVDREGDADEIAAALDHVDLTSVKLPTDTIGGWRTWLADSLAASGS